MTVTTIAVIIVNYGTAHLTAAAVDSVLAHTTGSRSVHLHVVDNASPGDDAADLSATSASRGWGDRVTLHIEDENHGFGRGNNVVLKRLSNSSDAPDAVLFLNPDAMLANDVISVLAEFLDANPQAGVAGAQITKPDGTPVTAAFRFPSVASEFAQQINFGPVSRLLRKRLVPLGADYPLGRVDWVAGAAVMIRMKTLRDVGFFDPAYFLYFEEIDLMREAQKAGWETWYVPDAQVIHAEGAATGVRSGGQYQRRRRPPYWYHSWQYYYRKHHGRFGAIVASAAYLTGLAGQYVAAFLRGRQVYAPLSPFADFWRYAVVPLLRTNKES